MVTSVTMCTAFPAILSRLVTVARARMCQADQHGRGETDPIQAVVDPHPDTLDPAQLAHQVRDQREGQETVRHRTAERPGLGSLRVNVNPLVILGVVGESVDPGLVDQEPFRRADFLADGLLQISQTVQDLHPFLPEVPRAWSRWTA